MLALLGEAQLPDADLARLRDYLALPDTRGTGRGLVASGSLSPPLAALYLAPLDYAMAQRMRRGQLVCYVRTMDDFVLLARTRWQLRRAIAALHEEIAPLGLHLHRVKRFIGRTTQGFDFLGYRIRAGARLRPSAEGLRRLRERARRLYERKGDRHRLRHYVLRWWRWHLGGLDGIVIQVAPDTSMDENGQPYFRVIVQTEKNYLGSEEGSLPIVAGMQATINIHTGKKSVMDYLIKPVLKLRDEAFRER